MLAMVDLRISNIESVRGAFSRVGAAVRIVEHPQHLDDARGVILPGVGAFGDGMASLREQGLVEPLRRHALERGRPLFGICLGMQLLADSSEEHGHHDGLGIVPGRVLRLRGGGTGLRVPNMGWCDVVASDPDSPLFAGSPTTRSFYFAHSYHLECADPEDVCATLDYGGPITAAIRRGNVLGIQFHPERSQEAGLDLLEAFCRHAGALPAGRG